MSSASKKAVIIGAGIGGIALAIRLRIKGYDVDVFEQNAYPGGKLSEINKNGYRFDAGPSLFTMPQFVDELFVLAKKNPRDYFNYHKLNNTAKYFFSDQSQMVSTDDPHKLYAEFDNINTQQSELDKFFLKSKEIYDITNHVFLEKSIHKLSTYLNWNTFLSILKIYKIDALRTMAKANAYFFKDSRAQQFFNRFATYNGSNPYKAPATLNVIQHYEHHFGAYYPKGGMYQITNSLFTLAKELGVHFHFNAQVNKIIVEQGQAKRVEILRDTLSEKFIADIVISNMDMVHTYKKLLPEIKAPKRLISQEKSSSAIIFYWGMSKKFDELQLHNIFFSENYKAEFDAISNAKIYNDPTIYINITAKESINDAPLGHENWFVMINVPNNQGQNWDEFIVQAKANIINKLNMMLNDDIQQYIVCEEVLDPRTIESKTSSFQGALYGNSSNNMFSAFLRHPNSSNKVKGLYFCGGSVHPGGGIPLALLSAKITSDLIKKI